MQALLAQVRLAVALRTARAAVGLSQEELATALGIPKTTLARAETLEGGLRADHLIQLQTFYSSLGLTFEFSPNGGVNLIINQSVIESAQQRLLDDSLRRRDRQKRTGGLINLGMGPQDPNDLPSAGGLLSDPAPAIGGLLSDPE